jgi:hypothetical protein
MSASRFENILGSRSFVGKSQLRKLLQVLHENIDSPGMTSELVIHKLWPTEIRAKRPADVATEMNRLRHALKTYYEEEGAADPREGARAFNVDHSKARDYLLEFRTINTGTP